MPKTTTNHACLGYAETRFFSITAVIADAMCKAAQVELLGLEPNGTEGILIRIGGADSAAVQAALDQADQIARRLGSGATTFLAAAPAAEIRRFNDGPMIINGLYGGREEMRPGDFSEQPSTTMSTQHQAIGILETQGLAASLAASDTMFKTANVSLVGKEKIGAAYVTIVIRGDVSAVQAALDAGSKAAEPLGKVIAAHVIARPHADLVALLPR